MCTLIRAFFHEASKISGSIVQAKTFAWNISKKNPVTSSRTDLKTFFGVENFYCQRAQNSIKVSFNCWERGSVTTVEKCFPLRRSARGELMLPFSDQTSGKLCIRDQWSFDRPLVEKALHRTLYLSTTAEDSQFWEDFCFSFEIPVEKVIQFHDAQFVKSAHLRNNNN